MTEDYFESERFDEETAELLAQERSAILESELEQDEHPLEEEPEEPPQRKMLKRELKALALLRMEDAARTEQDFKDFMKIWDRLDANRERRERDHEICREDVPIDYEAKLDAPVFPAPHDHMRFDAVRKGDLEDVAFDCPFEMHELIEDADLSRLVRDMKDDYKEVLYYNGLHLLSTKTIGCIRGQTDRNIRKLRATMTRKLHKQLRTALEQRLSENLPITTTQRQFLEECS